MKVKKEEREEGPDAEQLGQFLHLRTPFLLYGRERRVREGKSSLFRVLCCEIFWAAFE